MNDLLFTFAAALIELGVPIGLLLLIARRHRLRSWAALVLGAISPFILLYMWGFLSVLFFPSQASRWGFGAMWAMSLLLYVAVLFIASVVSFFVRRPKAAWLRFAIGLSPALLFVVLKGLGRV